MAAPPSLFVTLMIPAACGVGMHFVCHRLPPTSIVAFFVVLFMPPVAIAYASSLSFASFFFVCSCIIYLVSLGASIATYRLSPLHPLANCPGPRLAKVSRLWTTRILINGKQFEDYNALFERYGDVVRTGPNHLIVRDASAVPIVLGGQNRWLKNGRYTVARPDHSYELISIVEPGEHSRRRRIWEPAFTPSAIKSYAPRLHERMDQLSIQLDARLGQPLDIAEWLSFLAIDFMGDFAYGGMFNLTIEGQDHVGIQQFGVDGVRGIETLGSIPWIRPIILALPTPGVKKWFDVSLSIVEKRQQEKSQFRDLSHYLMNEDGDGPHPGMTTETLAREGTLALFAGADTTATSLAGVLFYLMTHPASFQRLRSELDTVAGDDSAHDIPIEGAKLGGLKYLEAVINETIRLQPAVPGGVQRLPPSDGGPVMVAGHLVPTGTAVQIPAYSLHRDPRYFSPDPKEFLPERWLPEEGAELAKSRGQDFQLDMRAYIPFSYGPTNCVGKALALSEMRSVVAALVRRYDFTFAPGVEPSEWTDNLGDAFAMTHGKLMVVLNKRAA